MRFPAFRITSRYPVTGPLTNRNSVCRGALSMLVSLDTDDDHDFEHRYLFELDGTLWGCDGPCTEPIDAELPVPRRVMIEGLTVLPPEYDARRADVACRGIADRDTGMGSIEVPTFFPGFDANVVVEVPMLRVGAFNGMFSAASPDRTQMVMAPLVPPDARESLWGVARVDTGGILVAAGGYAYVNVANGTRAAWEFHPWEIGWERVGSLPQGHSVGVAESYVDASGQPAVLFVGGLGTGGQLVLSADSYGRGRPAVSYPLLGPRVWASSVRIHERTDPVIAVMGGCAGTDFRVDYEVFYPVSRPCGEGPGFCTGDVGGFMVDGRCQAVTAKLPDGRVWIGSGLGNDGTMRTDGHLFDAAQASPSFGTPIAWPGTARRVAGVAQLTPEVTAVFGGMTSAGGSDGTDGWIGVTPPTAIVTQGTLREGRAWGVTQKLLDGRVLLAGGFDGTFLTSAEIFDRSNVEVGGFSDYIPQAGRVSCVPGVDCEETTQRRLGPVWARIEGSATWLEGAVLIVGSGPTAGAPEIFVPAYHCDGDAPVNRLDGVPVPDVEFCDRVRDPQPLTDPRRP